MKTFDQLLNPSMKPNVASEPDATTTGEEEEVTEEALTSCRSPNLLQKM